MALASCGGPFGSVRDAICMVVEGVWCTFLRLHVQNLNYLLLDVFSTTRDEGSLSSLSEKKEGNSPLCFDIRSISPLLRCNPTLLTYQRSDLRAQMKQCPGKGKRRGKHGLPSSSGSSSSRERAIQTKHFFSNSSSPQTHVSDYSHCMRLALHLRQPLASLYTRGAFWLQTPLISALTGFCLHGKDFCRLRRVYLSPMYANRIGESKRPLEKPSLMCVPPEWRISTGR
ncbi:hypothetical protein M441DRAFT_408656 [Trichoderma asperellum CBS 433.97]|uniref:Uncharacterized protein n=1 Tax=Trichoderma asperellum (strain ATCC 204424 / CBS 433.97 / NBRC 101777) TaxID=1042311 RepID=A0A2T3Z718_TRIA4|nr:hypothetical protein M441DRAFT_408656 [Trichoderma asperellum CBS 433.97]PTB40588.1 hypothetical protein M441DRAFT_408656 [Trichoderma asperellum CBS 433.97]